MEAPSGRVISPRAFERFSTPALDGYGYGVDVADGVRELCGVPGQLPVGERPVAVHHRDGFEGLVALLPPTPRRGLVLIDPPYELKEDYFAVVDTLKKAQKRWATGIYALWYPILGQEADKSRDMLKAIKRENFGNVLVAELEVAGQTADWGMNGSGMLIVSPPWMLAEQIEAFLKPLCAKLAQGAGAQYRVEWLNKAAD